MTELAVEIKRIGSWGAHHTTSYHYHLSVSRSLPTDSQRGRIFVAISCASSPRAATTIKYLHSRFRYDDDGEKEEEEVEDNRGRELSLFELPPQPTRPPSLVVDDTERSVAKI